MPSAARVTDNHVCPKMRGNTPHVGGPVTAGSPNVTIETQAAARLGDPLACVGVGAVDVLASGSGTVTINGKPASRLADPCVHGGVMVSGAGTVTIGDTSYAAPFAPEPVDPGKQHWVEVELLDQDGEPIGYEEVEVKIPDGRTIYRRLDKDGLARIVGIDPGNCEITFPKLGTADAIPGTRTINVAARNDRGEIMSNDTQIKLIASDGNEYHAGVKDGEAVFAGIPYGAFDIEVLEYEHDA